MKKTPKGTNVLSRVESLERAMNTKKLASRIPGSFTCEEYAEQTGRSPITVRATLGKLVAEGKLKKVKVPKMLVDGRVMSVFGYVVVDNKT